MLVLFRPVLDYRVVIPTKKQGKFTKKIDAMVQHKKKNTTFGAKI
jgi:hypothetical protein